MTRRAKHYLRHALIALGIAITAAFAPSTVLAPPAEAAAYPIGVYAPTRVGDTVEGWANLSRDCSNTFGCYNYIKIERSRLWGIEYVNGWWANANGWNSISAALPDGCHDYRTTTDSYNDAAGPVGAGVNVGPVGTSADGQTIYRYRTTWSSGWTRICR